MAKRLLMPGSHPAFRGTQQFVELNDLRKGLLKHERVIAAAAAEQARLKELNSTLFVPPPTWQELRDR